MAIPKPSFTLRSIAGQPVVASDLGTQVSHRKRRGLEYAEYLLVYLPGQLTATTAAELVTEWNNTKGGANTFSWKPPNAAVSVTARFVGESLDLQVESIVAYGARVLIETVKPV